MTTGALEIRESGELPIGIVVAGAGVVRAFELRPSTLADTYAAAAAVEPPEDLAENKRAQVAYQMAINDAQILCQIERLGDLDPPPGIEALIAAIDPDDMDALRAAAQRLKKKLTESRRSSPPGAAPNTSSSGPATG